MDDECVGIISSDKVYSAKIKDYGLHVRLMCTFLIILQCGRPSFFHPCLNLKQSLVRKKCMDLKSINRRQF